MDRCKKYSRSRTKHIWWLFELWQWGRGRTPTHPHSCTGCALRKSGAPLTAHPHGHLFTSSATWQNLRAQWGKGCLGLYPGQMKTGDIHRQVAGKSGFMTGRWVVMAVMRRMMRWAYTVWVWVQIDMDTSHCVSAAQNIGVIVSVWEISHSDGNENKRVSWGYIECVGLKSL